MFIGVSFDLSLCPLEMSILSDSQQKKSPTNRNNCFNFICTILVTFCLSLHLCISRNRPQVWALSLACQFYHSLSHQPDLFAFKGHYLQVETQVSFYLPSSNRTRIVKIVMRSAREVAKQSSLKKQVVRYPTRQFDNWRQCVEHRIQVATLICCILLPVNSITSVHVSRCCAFYLSLSYLFTFFLWIAISVTYHLLLSSCVFWFATECGSVRSCLQVDRWRYRSAHAWQLIKAPSNYNARSRFLTFCLWRRRWEDDICIRNGSIQMRISVNWNFTEFNEKWLILCLSI